MAGSKPIRERYEIADGYDFDRTTGEFINIETGEVAAKEEAVKIITAEEIIEKKYGKKER